MGFGGDSVGGGNRALSFQRLAITWGAARPWTTPTFPEDKVLEPAETECTYEAIADRRRPARALRRRAFFLRRGAENKQLWLRRFASRLRQWARRRCRPWSSSPHPRIGSSRTPLTPLPMALRARASVWALWLGRRRSSCGFSTVGEEGAGFKCVLWGRARRVTLHIRVGRFPFVIGGPARVVYGGFELWSGGCSGFPRFLTILRCLSGRAMPDRCGAQSSKKTKFRLTPASDSWPAVRQSPKADPSLGTPHPCALPCRVTQSSQEVQAQRACDCHTICGTTPPHRSNGASVLGRVCLGDDPKECSDFGGSSAPDRTQRHPPRADPGKTLFLRRG